MTPLDYMVIAVVYVLTHFAVFGLYLVARHIDGGGPT